MTIKRGGRSSPRCKHLRDRQNMAIDIIQAMMYRTRICSNRRKIPYQMLRDRRNVLGGQAKHAPIDDPPLSMVAQECLIPDAIQGYKTISEQKLKPMRILNMYNESHRS